MIIVNRVSTKTYQVDATSGTVTAQESTNGAAHVTAPDGIPLAVQDGAGTGIGIAQNRRDAGLTTTRRTMTFPAGQGPTKINVRYKSGTAPVEVYLVVNAVADQHADNELATPPTQDATTERYTVYATSVQPAGLEISSLTPIDRIDYKLSADDAGSVLLVEGA